MQIIKIIFMGTPDIAATMLKRLLCDGHQIIGVVTQPDKKVGRRQELHASPVKELALTYQIPVYQPTHIRKDYEELMELSPDLIVTCAYGQFIPDELLQMPNYGSINVHASLLPKLRGGAPIHKAIINGDKETGMSIMRMVYKMDAGAVMSQCRVCIDKHDTTGMLFDKLAIAGADLLSTSINEIINGNAEFIEQDETQATFAYTISKEEEYINFNQDVTIVYNHIRGLIPSPCGYARINGKSMKFYQVRMIEDSTCQDAGCVVGLVDGGFAICTQNGLILIDEIQMEGKAKTDAKSFYNGAGKQLIGMKFS